MGISKLSKTSEKRLSKILEYLYVSNVLTSSEILSGLRLEGVVKYRKTKYVKSFFNFLKSRGIFLMPDVMVHKLRLKVIVVVVNVKKIRRCNLLSVIASSSPFVRSIVLSIPNKVIISLYIPEDIINVHKNYEKMDIGTCLYRTYLYDHIIRSKPLPSYLVRAINGSVEDLVNNASFETCFSRPLFLPSDWDSKPKIDGLVLNVLDTLLIDPTLTLKELAKMVSDRLNKKLSLQKVSKAVHRASRFIYGYRVSVTRTSSISNLKMGIVVNGVSNAQLLCLSIIRHPLLLSCGWSNDKKDTVIYVSLPEGGIGEFKDTLFWFIDQFKGYVVDSFEYVFNKDYVSVINIPHTEWAPLLKAWKYFQDPVPMILKRLRDAECIEF